MDGGALMGRCQKGFTLIEVMIAMAVLLFGILAVMGMQFQAIRGNLFSRDLRSMTVIGRAGVETAKAGDLSATAATGTAVSSLDLDPMKPGVRTVTRRRWAVNDCLELSLTGDDNSCDALTATCVTDPDGGTKVTLVQAVRVRTCWRDGKGDLHSVTFDSLEEI